MNSTLRKSVLAAVGGGAIAIASALITGPTGNDGLEGSDISHTAMLLVFGQFVTGIPGTTS